MSASSISSTSSTSTSLLRMNVQAVAIAHTVCSASAFIAAFILGYTLHFEKIVKNQYYGYPDEWFPSVSATIGDRYPERSVFQILIALTSGPRFLLLFFTYIRLYKKDSRWPLIGLLSGIVRTVTCGGWVYITSTDDHDWHDIFMISYIVLTIPWNMAVIKLSPPRSTIKRYRKYSSIAFFGTLVPLIYLYIQHKVHQTPGSYSYYAYTEWGLIILDILFDSWSIKDFKDLYLELRPTNKNDDYFALTFNITQNQHYTNYNEKDSTNLDDQFIPKSKAEFNSTYIQIAINIINSFMLWTILTALFVCVWYFPLWYMGISGYEVVVVTTCSPVLLLNSKLRNYAYQNVNKIRFAACLFGVGSCVITEPAIRLVLISVGNALSFIAFTSEIALIGSTKSVESIRSYAATFMLGLTLSTISKFAYWTNNPVWPIMNSHTGGLNKIGLIIGLIAAYYTYIPGKVNFVSSSKKAPTPSGSILPLAVGLGSFVFSLLAMLTDTSVIILWTWDGYPINGPVPVPYGLVTLSVMCAGIYSGFHSFKSYKTITILGVVGAFLLYSFHGWVGYFGGMLYAFWLCYIAPMFFQQLALQGERLVRVVFTALIFAVIFSLMHVWVVAYAFVPGGPLLRERTDIVLGSSVVAILLFLYQFRNDYNGTSEITSESKEAPSTASPSSTKMEIKNQSKLSKFANICIAFILLSSVIVFNRLQYTTPKPYHPKSRLVTAGIWTIHFGLDNDMWASEYRMRDLIRDAELDIVGLLESDTQRIIMGNRDITQRIAEELDMYADFGPGPNKHTWGAALLSKFPILNSTHHLLPSPVGELAPAIHATLDMYGTPVDVVVFHSGQEEDEEDRRLQSLELQRIMGSSDRPMILLSYLVTNPHEGNYHTYVSEKSGMHDIDPSDDDRWCEYILYKKLKRTGYARISRGSITDTELQVGKFVVPPPGEVDEEYSNDKVPEVWINKDKRFPEMFHGEGVREHAYHVFDEPRYFI